MSWLIPTRPIKMNLKVCEGISPSTKCRYFATDGDDDHPVCLKLNPELKQTIDEEITCFEQVNAKRIKLGKHIDESLPFGDNCPGVEMKQ